MKFLFFLCFAPVVLLADLVDFKMGYFFFQDHHIREMYHAGSLMPSIEGNVKISEHLAVFSDIGVFYKGRSQSSYHGHSSVFIVPMSLGLSYIYPCTKTLDFYLKAAPNYLYFHARQKDLYVPSSTKKNFFGATFGTGFYYHLTKRCFLDFFFNYLYDKKKFTDPNSGIHFRMYAGGFYAGMGAGFSF